VTLVVHALVLINIDSNMHGDEIKINILHILNLQHAYVSIFDTVYLIKVTVIKGGT